MIRSNEKINLKLFLPYGYTNHVLKICDELGYTMPRGGKITAQDIRNTLNGRENLVIEDAIYRLVEINKKEFVRLQQIRREILKNQE